MWRRKKARYDQYKAALDGVHGLRILPFKEESTVRSNHWFYSLYLKDLASTAIP